MPSEENLKFHFTSNHTDIGCVARYFGDQIVHIMEESRHGEISKITPYIPNIVTIEYKKAIIYIMTFWCDTTFYMAFGSSNVDDIRKFLEECRKQMSPNGYTKYTSSYRRYEYDKGMNVSTGLKFDDLIGVDTSRDSIIQDIDRYFSNINKFRLTGMNKGLNYIIYGPPGTGKTSFACALAHHYKACLFVPGDRTTSDDVKAILNPVHKGISIVLMDDFAIEHYEKEYIHAMFDNGQENVIRIFITNDFTEFKSDAFISRCRQIFKFDSPSLENIGDLISKLFDVTREQARPLIDIISSKEMERQQICNKKIQEYENLCDDEKKKTHPPKPFTQLAYRDINYLLSEFIGSDNPISNAINKIEDLVEKRCKHIGTNTHNKRKGGEEGCSVM